MTNNTANSTLFILLVVVGFVIFATQAGAKESRFLRSPVAAIVFLAVVGAILYAIWYSGSGVVFTH